MTDQKERKGPDPKSRVHDLFTVILGGGAAVLLATLKLHIDTTAVPYPFYKGPILFPLIVLSIMVLSCLPSFFRLIKRPSDSDWILDGEGLPYRPVVILVFLISFFIFGITLIGVEASSFLFLLISCYYLGYRKAKIFILVPLIYTFVIAVIFKYILGIWFPQPWLFELIWG